MCVVSAPVRLEVMKSVLGGGGAECEIKMIGSFYLLVLT
jgi:hypothetical protein